MFLGAAVTAGAVVGDVPGDVSGTARQGVLVLHGGQAIRGEISQAEDLYRVALPGGEIRIRSNQVAYHCATMEEAYRRRREAIREGTADDHIELARWCQRNGLLSAAAGELANAMAMEPNHPAIAHVERQLKAAMEPAPPRAAVPAAAQSAEPSDEALDAMIRGMTPGVVEMFTSGVQPLLLSSCATGGCHGPRSAERLRLLRGRTGYPPSRRATQRNLHAVLACIDRQRPENSPLLVEAIRAHGTSKGPALGNLDQAKYRLIVQWVYRVAGTRRPETTGPSNVPAGPAVKEAWPGKRTVAVNPAVAMNSASDGPIGSPLGVAGASASSPDGDEKPSVQRGATLKRFVPADPFDPAIFNRRYHQGEETPPTEEK
ncbi:MAG TPA: hypothetical protein VJL29_08280 [Thermoguttaceae bacterium]|nr:hypothetical protein [Thermoguttaceae bacterium]